MCRRRLSRSFPYQKVSRETFCKKQSPREGAERLNYFQVKGFFFISAAVRG